MGVPIPEAQIWLRNTEELFYRDPPPFSITTITSHIRPDLRASRRNTYWRMFGMDLNHGTDEGQPYPYIKADAANNEFVTTFEEFLREAHLAVLEEENPFHQAFEQGRTSLFSSEEAELEVLALQSMFTKIGERDANTNRAIKDEPLLQTVPFELSRTIVISKNWALLLCQMARTYNRFGGLIGKLATKLTLELPAVLAVWFVESVGHNVQPAKAWGNPQYRETVDQPFKSVHTGKQEDEYAAFNLAIRLAWDTRSHISVIVTGQISHDTTRDPDRLPHTAKS